MSLIKRKSPGYFLGLMTVLACMLFFNSLAFGEEVKEAKFKIWDGQPRVEKDNPIEHPPAIEGLLKRQGISTGTEAVELTPEQQEMVDDLNSRLIPLGPSVLDLSDREMSFLNGLKNARIVGMGEATHGNKEFFQMKMRMFRYLVEHRGFKAIAFEADFAESIYIDRWVCGGEGDLEEIMKDKMHFWIYLTTEVRELLQWMRDYNRGKGEGAKIHYYGFDCQFNTYQPVLLEEYLTPGAPELWASFEPDLTAIQAYDYDAYSAMTEEDFNTTMARLEAMEQELLDNEQHLRKQSSRYDFKVARQLLKSFKQVFDVKYHSYTVGYSLVPRDLYMADNALWISDQPAGNGKLALWGHNWHISRLSPSDSTGSIYGAMGYYLGQELGKKYQNFAFGFSLGEFRALTFLPPDNMDMGVVQIPEEPRWWSTNFYLHHAAHDNFAVNLDAFPGDSPMGEWFAEPHRFFTLGGSVWIGPNWYFYYLPSTVLKGQYNWLIYIDTTQGSDWIDPRL